MKNKTKRIMICLAFMFIVGIGILVCLKEVKAFSPQQLNTNYNLIVTSNNATSCNLTYIQTPTTLRMMKIPMTRNLTDFSILINKSNFTEIGDVCMGIACSDGVSYETGSKCVEVTPSGRNGASNIVFMIFVISLIYLITFIGFFGKNEIVTILGGMFMIGLSVYLVQNGVIVYQDWITNYLAYITFGIGAFFSLYASLSLFTDL
jgi:hypothetical protein